MQYVKKNWTTSLAVLSAILGMTGYLVEKDAAAFSGLPLVFLITDALFFTIKLFGGGGPESIADQANVHWFALVCLNVARFTAPLSLVSAFLARFDGLWKPVAARFLLRRLRTVDLILGEGAAAKRLHDANIVLRRWTVLGVNMPETEKLGATIDFDTRTISLSMRALKDEVAMRALSVNCVAITGADDLANINLSASDVVQNILAEQKLVHIADEALRLDLVAAGGLRGRSNASLHITSEHELEARAFFHTNDFFLDEVQAGRSRSHLVFIGFGDDARSLLIQFVKICPHPDLLAPRVTIFSFDHENDLAFVQVRLPIELGLLEVEVINFNRAMGVEYILDQIKSDNAASLFYVSEAGYGAHQRLAFELAALAERRYQGNSKIWLKGTLENRLWSQALDQFEACPVGVLTQNDVHMSTTSISGEIDKLAQAIHAGYSGYKYQISGNVPPDVIAEWKSLDENLRASNRRAADSTKTKLEALGIGKSHFPCPTELPAITDARLEQMAEAEHDSWMADRFVNGWRHGGIRDSKKRIHNNLVAYHRLSETDKELDRQQIQTVLGLLRSPAESP